VRYGFAHVRNGSKLSGAGMSASGEERTKPFIFHDDYPFSFLLSGWRRGMVG
jgi:hypothetical protein